MSGPVTLNPPTLHGRIDVLAERYLRDVQYAFTSLSSRVEALDNAPVQTANYTAIERALQANGSDPLNVSNLIGLLAQPQVPFFQVVKTLPQPPSPLAQNGTVVIYNGILYWYNATTQPGSWLEVATAGVLLMDTRAHRLSLYSASSQPLGIVFLETDTRLLYVNQGTYGSSNWNYLIGTYRIAQSQVSGLGLGQYDDGALIVVTDYAHKLRWSWSGGPGSFGWDDNDPQSGTVEMSVYARGLPAWKVLDGTGDDGSPVGVSHPITYLLPTGALGSITRFDSLEAGLYLKGGSAFTGVANAGSGGSITGATAAEAAHTHSVAVAAATSAVPIPDFVKTQEVIGTQENYLKYSQDQTNAAWIKNGTVTATLSLAGPDGSSSCEIDGLGTYPNYLAQYSNPAMPAGSYEPSFWLLQIASSGVIAMTNCYGPAEGEWRIDLSKISSFWERITSKHPAVTVLTPFVASGVGGHDGFAMIAYSGGPLSFYIWGAQTNKGTLATGYTLTTSAQVTVAVPTAEILFESLPGADHTHAVSGQTVTSGAGSSHTHGAGTLAMASADVPNEVFLPYLRR